MFWTTLGTLVFGFYYFFVMPDEVFEINIDSTIEKLDTVYYPKLGSGGHYNTICYIYHREMDDTIMLDGERLIKTKKGRVCSDGYEVLGDSIPFHYNRYKAKNVKIMMRYEFYEY